MDFSSENYKQELTCLNHCIQYFKRTPLNSHVCIVQLTPESLKNIECYLLSQKNKIFSISCHKKINPKSYCFQNNYFI